MLESLEITNIGALNLTEPQAQIDLPFDPERDIPKDDVIKAIKYGREKYAEKDFLLYSVLLRNLKILFPGSLTEEDEGYAPFARSDALAFGFRLSSLVENVKGSDNPSSFLREEIRDFIELAVTTKILYPSYGQRQSEELENFKEVLLKDVEVFKSGNSLSKVFAANLFIHDLSLLIEPDEEDWSRNYQVLQLGRDKRNLGFLQTPYIAASLRLAYPDRMRDFIVTPEEWQKMRLLLKSYRGENWESYIYLATRMKILAAEDILFTENGLEFVMPGSQVKLIEEIPALPEVRKF